MGKEIERKFLTHTRQWEKFGAATHIRQGYISANSRATVRVRIAGERAWLTIKGNAVGLARDEYEYEIPVVDAAEMLSRLCENPPLEKTRYRIAHDGLVWEVDEFAGDNQGLVLAEVELTGEDQQISMPDWIDREVTGDPRYYNVWLSQHPFTTWRDR